MCVCVTLWTVSSSCTDAQNKTLTFLLSQLIRDSRTTADSHTHPSGDKVNYYLSEQRFEDRDLR